MKRLVYGNTVISDKVPDYVFTVSQAFYELGYNVFSREDLRKMYVNGIPCVTLDTYGNPFFNYFGCHLQRIITVK